MVAPPHLHLRGVAHLAVGAVLVHAGDSVDVVVPPAEDDHVARGGVARGVGEGLAVAVHLALQVARGGLRPGVELDPRARRAAACGAARAGGCGRSARGGRRSRSTSPSRSRASRARAPRARNGLREALADGRAPQQPRCVHAIDEERRARERQRQGGGSHARSYRSQHPPGENFRPAGRGRFASRARGGGRGCATSVRAGRRRGVGR